MNKKINISTIIIAIIIVVVIGFLIRSGDKNKVNAPAATVGSPAVDAHGHPLASNNPVPAALDDLMNKPAREFALADKDGKIYSLNELRGKNTILFFNEGLMCYPACWNQIVALAKDERFKNADTVVLSVVVDSPEEWQKAVKQMPELAAAAVVFDKNAELSKKFGMLSAASSMHYGLFPGHTFVIIDKEGIVRYVFDDPNMGIRNDQLATELNRLN